MSDPARGKREIIGLTTAATALLLALAALTWLGGGAVDWFTALGRSVILLGLGALTLQRRNWARQLLLAWFAFMAVLLVVVAVNVAAVKPLVGTFLFGAAALWVYASIKLYASPNIAAFMAGPEAERVA